MPIRDLVIVAVVLCSLPIGLLIPFYGLLVYAWISYMSPHTAAWGFAQTLPVAKLSALTVMAGTVLNRAADLAVLRQRETVLMVLLWGMFTISTLLAMYPAPAFAKWQDVSKVIIMGLLAAVLLTEQKRLRYFLLVIGLSIGFYGFKGGLWSISTGGQYLVYGPESSIMGANNAIGLALNMCLPVLWYTAQEERGWLKRALQLTFFLSMPAILFTYSRASALTLPIVLLAILLKSRNRNLIIVVVLAGGFLALPYVPERWWDRQQTVTTYEEDTSAMSRIDNWRIVWRLALDRPLTGAGFEFQTREIFTRYFPEFIAIYGERFWNTHSIYFAMLGSHGFPGLILFLMMIGSCLWSCRRMQRQVRNRPDLNWIASYSNIIQISFIAFLVNGAFVNMEYFDLPYHWVAVVAALKVVCARALADESAGESGSGEPAVGRPVLATVTR